MNKEREPRPERPVNKEEVFDWLRGPFKHKIESHFVRQMGDISTQEFNRLQGEELREQAKIEEIIAFINKYDHDIQNP